MRFEFTYNNYDPEAEGEFPNETTITKSVSFDDAAPWVHVLDQFVTFLGSCYGYDISDQVEYKSFGERFADLQDAYGLDDEEEESTEGREFQ